MEVLKGFGGKILQTSLSREGEDKLQAALDAQPEPAQAVVESRVFQGGGASKAHPSCSGLPCGGIKAINLGRSW